MLAGFGSEALVLIRSCEAPDDAWAFDEGASAGDGYTLGDDMQNFFRRMFQYSSEDTAPLIQWEAVRRGKVVLEVEVESDADFEIATDIIEDLRLGWTDFGE
ncbi:MULTISPECIES: hypothetical protein [unclassified Duganella]|uniref:hypothetical protein n=1 Tax=unclassified Duganella TaxID=2636909 RepID=UPI000E34239F|nr:MULTISPECIES: hypothetical protein [unclassified Duganella]RFP07999.1 hypothetical protein D0T23_30775 [Duganella sp. BJB475]RFP23842.1 hypothetical protein D0T21_29485 [Duganella sp. BJB476]